MAAREASKQNAENFFRNASLDHARFHGTFLFNVDFDGSDLTQSELGFTTFSNCDLQGAKGLETVDHQNPSSIGIDTIFRSNNRIPEVFLRGCGLLALERRCQVGQELDEFH
ncbi:MAG TPA: pentapeptide repeat-containing protein [Pyrinomonadaceae bacterium]